MLVMNAINFMKSVWQYKATYILKLKINLCKAYPGISDKMCSLETSGNIHHIHRRYWDYMLIAVTHKIRFEEAYNKSNYWKHQADIAELFVNPNKSSY